jgi:hypothetical protein
VVRRGWRAAERSGVLDIVAYGLSAGLGLGLWLATRIETHHAWGAIAVWVYGAATIVAVVFWWTARRSGEVRLRSRVALAALVAIGATVVPTGVEITRRVELGWGRHAQSEVIITEEAARALRRGEDPYAATYEHGPLAARPIGTTTHYAYLPGMWLYGVPAALAGPTAAANAWWTDARIWFAVGGLVAFGLAIRRWRDPTLQLRASLPMIVWPTGALLIATGGDDIPALGLMLLGATYAAEERWTAAGVALGLACATKQPCFLALAFLAVAAARTEGVHLWASRAARRLVGVAVAIAVVVVVPFVLWSPSDFVEDAVKFPLGIGQSKTAAGTPTLGSALMHVAGAAKPAVAGLLVLAIAAMGAWALIVRPPRDAAQALSHLAVFFAVALLLAPAARIGYLVYPVDFAVWASCLAAWTSSPGASPDDLRARSDRVGRDLHEGRGEVSSTSAPG